MIPDELSAILQEEDNVIHGAILERQSELVQSAILAEDESVHHPECEEKEPHTDVTSEQG